MKIRSLTVTAAAVLATATMPAAHARLALVAASAAAMAHGAALGTSAVVDGSGRLWIAYTEPRDGLAVVMVQRSDDGGSSWQVPIAVVAAAEPVAAEGENRPKLAFGTDGEIYVAWTTPTPGPYTGDIRFTRSLDGGKRWAAPTLVHRDRQLITHRFESMMVDATGRIWVVWIDKRDLKLAEAAGRPYTGAALYYAYSEDRGTSWRGDFKLADGSCECCRIALTADEKGRPAALWRHVFAADERDHAFAVLEPQGAGADRGRSSIAPARVTFDRWRIAACPHHGPSLAIAADGTRHAVWFNQVDGQGRVFYGQLTQAGPRRVQALPAGAAHADVAVAGDAVAVAWKRFDGEKTRIETWLSLDAGERFSAGPVLDTALDSDQPRLVGAPQGILLVWRRGEGVVVRNLSGVARLEPATAGKESAAPSAVSAPAADIEPFRRDTLAQIEKRYAGTAFWLVLWDLECTYCMKSLRNFAAAQQRTPGLELVTVATDPISAAREIKSRLAQLGVHSDAYAFAGAPQEALRFAIDPAWSGEKPRAYRYSPDGARETISGVIDPERLSRQ